MSEESILYAEDLLKRAFSKESEAYDHLKKNYNYPMSISSSQECIELSIKSLFQLLTGEHPKKHEFKDEEFMKVLEKIPKDFEHYKFPRLYLLSKFWSGFYTIAKYGIEKLKVGPEKLFEMDEAELALKHASQCYNAVHHLLYDIKLKK